MTPAFIGIGSNINAEDNMIACAKLLRTEFPSIIFSSVYRSAARDRTDQDDFLNAVAKIETEKTPEELQTTLKTIETKLGKNPPYAKGPRTIDLDILLIPNSQLPTPNSQLIIPHPRMHERRFVLEPLCELLEGSSKDQWNALLMKNLDQTCERGNILL